MTIEKAWERIVEGVEAYKESINNKPLGYKWVALTTIDVVMKIIVRSMSDDEQGKV